MVDRSKVYNNILKMLVLVVYIVGFSFITKQLFKGVVIDRDIDKNLIYSTNSYTYLKVFSLISISLISIYLIYTLTNTIFIKVKSVELIKDNFLLDLIINGIIILVSIIVLIVFPFSHDKRNSFSFSFSLSNILMSLTYLIVVIINKYNLFEKEKTSIAIIAEGSMLAALAVSLSLVSKTIVILELPNGGSFSLSMLPLFIFGFRRGIKNGLMMGGLYGLINLITDGLIIHWGSIFFDYIIPFSLVAGVAGLFSKKALDGSSSAIVLGVLLGGLVRYLLHSLSGVIFFSEYADEMNPWFYSFVFYNLPYMLVSTIGSLLIILPLSERLIFSDTRIK